MQGCDEFFDLGQSSPIGEAICPNKRIGGNHAGVVRRDDFRDAHLALIVLTEIH
jgi:hypothetical protein